MFFLESWLIALVIAPPAGALGCFIVWRRMAFFADSLAHASVLGLALALIIEVNLIFGVVLTGAAVTLLMWAMRHRRELPADALLSLIAHVMLGGGLIIIALAEIRVDLLSYLLGEWLAVSYADLWRGGGVMLVILGGLWLARQPLLAATAQAEIAKVERPRDWRSNLAFFVLLTLFVSVSVPTVGLILLNTLMIIPALSARHWAGTPYAMIGLSIVFALLIICGGLGLSLWLDLPASPAAAVCGGGVFALSFLLKRLLKAPAPKLPH